MLAPTRFQVLLLLKLLLHRSSGSPLTILKQAAAEVPESRHQLLVRTLFPKNGVKIISFLPPNHQVQAMAEGLKSSLKRILAREMKEETRGEVTAWLPHTGEKLPHTGEKPERELVATLEFSLKMHQPNKKYGKPKIVHYDFEPQTRSDIQSESELIFGSDPVADIEPLDLQLTPSSASLNLTRVASDWANLPDNQLEIPTDPKSMIYNFARNMIINVLYMVAMLANRMMAA